MPKLKQPLSLGKMSLSALLEFVVNFCDQLSVQGSLDQLRQGIAIVKKHICSRVPWYLLADFCSGFLDEFYAKERPVFHKKAASEILMDIEIIGLRGNGRILAYLDPWDVHRVRRWQELDMTDVPETMSLDKFHLDDLTTFVFPSKCTDLDLAIIVRNCRKLEVLKVDWSQVTDEGLRAMSPCPELRVVDITNCPVSCSGINSLLSSNTKIEDFAHSHCSGLYHSDSSVYPSMNRFVFDSSREDETSCLPAIVTKFPNLIYLEMKLRTAEDLSALKSLDKLTGIEIEFTDDMYYDELEETLGSLKTLLSCIGKNITTLKLSCWNHGYFWYQDELNFIFRSCPNMENLGFDQGDGLVVIPPFPKLKQLVPRIPINFEQIEILDDPALEFSELLSLETLSVLNYGMNLQAIQSIMLDDHKFPNLSVIETNFLKPEDLEQIELTARTRNLDFKIKYDPESNWYLEYRFGENRESDDDSVVICM